MRRLPIFILLGLLITGICAIAGKKHTDYDLDAARRKAAALYAHSAVLEALDSSAAALRLIDYAAQLAPEDSALRYDRDRMEMFTAMNESIYFNNIDDLFARWLNHPANLKEGHLYGKLAAMVGDYGRAQTFLLAVADKNPGDWDLLSDLCEVSNRSFIRHREGEPADTAGLLDAINYVKEAEKILGVSTATTSQKVRSLMLISDTASIDSAINLMLRENADDAFAHFYAGDIYARSDRDSMALVEVQEAYRIDPDSYDIAVGLATAYENLGDSLKYKQLALDIIKNVNFDRKERLNLLGEYMTKYVDEDDPVQSNEGAQLIEDMLDEQNDARINEIKAIFLLRQDKKDEAFDYFKKTVDLDSTNYNALMHTLVLYTVKKDYANVVDLVNRGFATWAADTLHTIEMPVSTFNFMAQAEVNALLEMDKADTAVDFVHNLADLMKRNGVKDEYIGETLARMAFEFTDKKLYEQSYEFYDRALELDDDPMLANDYAYVLAEQNKDLDKALELINKAMRSKGDNANVLDTYAWLMFRRGQYDEARKAIDDAMTRSVKARKDNEKYKADLEAGEIEDDNDDYDIDLLTDEQRAARAEHRMDIAAKYQPSLWQTLYEHAGDIYFMCQDPERALFFWQKALELEPDNDLLKRKVEHRTFFYE